MKIHILGCYSPFPSALGGTSGYLLQTEYGNILIDCGSGVIHQLHKHIQAHKLDAVIISHTHADHISDLSVLKYAIDIPKHLGITKNSLTFYGPIELKSEYSKFEYKDSLIYQPICCNDRLNISGVDIVFCKTKHPVPCYAMKFTYHNKVIVYTADTEYCNEILNFATDADLLIIEATMLEKDFKPDSGHLSARLAAELGHKANVKQLLLTHLWPYYSTDLILQEAQQNFKGPITIASVGQEYYIR
ncbi:hypothetical protein BHU72_08095 [Desulfuribacillus stibiiarsenatis]|uniref:Metallo-beta-lactamase domain-containing protein n=1 Tax=Desulfuribacillus stibiiarsenatis TaxID=1390249 RepID=A0A1E5L3V4_9FIRM|nr:MBL fold metallo-hydrolase [Desulfuribacillus stibiiarsenatis]OEH84785.1 hypothetical protein BHU72_08095 [Desulfuribacillus stibiiarsenatis]